MWLGAEVTRGRIDSGAEVTRAEVSGAEVVGAEVTRGRGGSGAEVSINHYRAHCVNRFRDLLRAVQFRSRPSLLSLMPDPQDWVKTRHAVCRIFSLLYTVNDCKEKEKRLSNNFLYSIYYKVTIKLGFQCLCCKLNQ